MWKTKTLLALTVVFLATRTTANHMYIDTDTLHGWCQPYEVGDTGPGPLCAGFITAVADIMAHGVPIHDHRACVPHTVDLYDLRNLVVNELGKHFTGNHKNAHKNELDKYLKGSHKNAHIWVAKVFSRAYPCSPTNGQ